MADPFPSFAQPQTASNHHPAVQHCLDAWLRTYKEERALGKGDWTGRQSASEAYRAAMPELTSSAGVKDFLACVAHGTLIEAISEKTASRLLAAAQIALRAHRRSPEPEPATEKNSEKNL